VTLIVNGVSPYISIVNKLSEIDSKLYSLDWLWSAHI
jgi:hypothetical protein